MEKHAENNSRDIIPFDEFVLKRRTRCDMQTTYDKEGNVVGGCNDCYEFAFADKSWMELPVRMEPEVTLLHARRIGEHARNHQLDCVRLIMHGGEPLLGTAAEIEEFSEILQTEIHRLAPDVEVSLGVQSNGLNLDAEKITVLEKYEYKFGLSIDGDREASDRHRRDRKNNSTHDRAVEAAGLLSNSNLSWGILAVIDTNNDPVTTLNFLASLEPSSISLLLPHANHSVSPRTGTTPYGVWLSTAFDWYVAQSEESRITMPIFDAYMDVFLGGQSTHESVGNRTTQELFMLPNRDGYYQRLDTLKSTEAGALAIGMNAREHSLDEVALRDPGIIARRIGRAGLAQECIECPLLKVCGGGYYPHRFKAGDHPLRSNSSVNSFVEAFKHPTVYCADQKELLPHIAEFIETDLGLARGALIKALET